MSRDGDFLVAGERVAQGSSESEVMDAYGAGSPVKFNAICFKGNQARLYRYSGSEVCATQRQRLSKPL